MAKKRGPVDKFSKTINKHGYHDAVELALDFPALSLAAIAKRFGINPATFQVYHWRRMVALGYRPLSESVPKKKGSKRERK